MEAGEESALDACMARLARGEREAFDPLFRALAPRAERLARLRLDPQAAQDVTQSSLLKVFAHAHEFTPGRSVLAWFYAIVSNEIHAARRPLRSHDSLGEHDAAAETRSAEELLLESELARALEAAIDELDADASTAIHALLGRGPKPEIEPASLRKRISRAYARLRALLGVTR